MPKPDASKTISFKSAKELSEWLQVNHATESELMIKMFKKGSGIPSVNWNEVVVESLCWGWMMVSRSRLMTNPTFNGLLRESLAVIGRRGIQNMSSA